ncbi:MAG: hypothetical protein MUP36_02050 [Demequinaceae bacterium]|nr:hypothetical protein [Demequinaceae bacterium]
MTEKEWAAEQAKAPARPQRAARGGAGDRPRRGEGAPRAAAPVAEETPAPTEKGSGA